MSLRRWLFSGIQVILDLSICNFCLSLTGIGLTLEVRVFLCGSIAVLFLFNSMYGFHNWTFDDEIKQCIRSVVYALLVSTLFLYSEAEKFPILAVIMSFAMFILFCLTARYIFRRLLFSMGLLYVPVIIIGAGIAGELLAQKITSSKFIARKILGFLDDDELKQGDTVYGIPVIGRTSDFERLQRDFQADEAVIAIPTASREELAEILNKVEELTGKVLYVPDMYMLTTMTAGIRSIDGLPIISSSQGLLNPANRLIKSIVDYIGGLAAVTIASPLMIYIAWKIKNCDGGKIFFKHERVGQGLKPFKVYKFRTMVENAEEILREMLKDEKLKREFEEAFKFKDDKRITPIGKFLRRTSLDELPQLFNVLRGEMSLVGPRPIVQREVELYYGYRTALQIFHIKPGMTGYWQVSGRNDVENYQQRVDFDLYYIHNWSVWLDIIIMLKTIREVLKGSGAY